MNRKLKRYLSTLKRLERKHGIKALTLDEKQVQHALNTQLCDAAAEGDSARVMLLLSQGANAVCDGMIAIETALDYGYRDIAKILIDSIDDISDRDAGDIQHIISLDKRNIVALKEILKSIVI